MNFLTGQGIIDDALSIIKNNSTPIRTKMLVWLNVAAQKLAVARPWEFLNNGSATLTPVNNVLYMPADFGRFQSLRAGTAFFFDSRNKLTPGEAFQLDAAIVGMSVPRGYTEGFEGVTVGPVTTRTPIITLHGAGYSDTVTVNYIIEPPTIADSTAATCWPVQCRALFQRFLLDGFYEYDMDERAVTSLQLNAGELYELKKWDNTQKPRTQKNPHGYRGSR